MVRSSIIKQPSYNSHFHYAAEPNWNKHGCLKDRGNGYPTVVLQLSPEETLDRRGRKREFYLLCSLHNYQNGQRCLSPHLLMLRGNTNDINYKFIFDRMDENPKNDLGRIWRLENAAIARTKKDHQEISLANKKQEFENLTLQEFDFDELKGDKLDVDLLTVSKRIVAGIRRYNCHCLYHRQ